MFKRILVLWMALLLSAPSLGGGAFGVFEFSSDENRQRYRMFLEELRCPKCKNNNLAGTNSQIAIDLRRELHRMIEEGKSDAEIIDFMVIRYGDFVLYRPPVQGNTMALWIGPVVFLGIGAMVAGVIVWRRRRFTGAEDGLNPEEQAKLASLLEAEENGRPPIDRNH